MQWQAGLCTSRLLQPDCKGRPKAQLQPASAQRSPAGRGLNPAHKLKQRALYLAFRTARSNSISREVLVWTQSDLLIQVTSNFLSLKVSVLWLSNMKHAITENVFFKIIQLVLTLAGLIPLKAYFMKINSMVFREISAITCLLRTVKLLG